MKEEMLAGLPIEYCEFCECKRIFSEGRKFCLTCGRLKEVKKAKP